MTKFGMDYVEVVPAENGDADDVSTIPTAAALYIERLPTQTDPVTIGMGGHCIMPVRDEDQPPASRMA